MKLDSENPMCRLAQNQTRQIHRIYPKTKGNLRETCKLQDINPISPTPRLNFGIIQIIIKSLSTISVLSSIKIYFSVQYLSFQPDQDSGILSKGVCKVNVFFSYVGLYFVPFNLICNITTVRKKGF